MALATAWAAGGEALGQPAPAPPPAPPTDAGAAQEVTTNPGEKNVNLEDRVKSVQRKSFLKKHRLSLSVDGAASINDAFFQKWGGGGQVAFAFSDPFAVVARFDYFGDQELENIITAKQALGSELYATRLHFLTALDFEWTPIYGKFSTFNKIVHFDLYLLAGVGAADGEQGVLPATEVGLGERLFLTEWFSTGIEGRYAFYVDNASGEPSTLQKTLLVSAVATFWIPVHGPEETR
ncbi:MAG: outer membrane beta-barrel domain-containing protein [Myxococcales bacterium]